MGLPVMKVGLLKKMKERVQRREKVRKIEGIEHGRDEDSDDEVFFIAIFAHQRLLLSATEWIFAVRQSE